MDFKRGGKRSKITTESDKNLVPHSIVGVVVNLLHYRKLFLCDFDFIKENDNLLCKLIL